MPFYAATIFLSAFLLFQVQPIIARIILPWFGGSAAVWTTCLLFFQVVLLLGYLYAHGSVRYLKPKMQTRMHSLLLAVSVLCLPILPSPHWKPQGTEEPTLRILLLLLVTIGLPYFLLSTTGPLLQAWYAARGGADGQASFPYRLYALSNVGSMLALLSYPPLVEPVLTTRQQSGAWSGLYIGFVVLCIATALRTRGAAWTQNPEAAPQEAPQYMKPPGWPQYLTWTALAACASALLLAITNHLSQNVAAIPFLWVLPLSLYLLSFIICFGGKDWQWRPFFLPIPAMALGFMAYASTDAFKNIAITLQIPVFAGGLFVCCVLCHGELARRKPHPRYLTVFYLMISLGGALGGLFVGWLAPHLFNGYYELSLSLFACAVVTLFAFHYDPDRGWRDPGWLLLATLTLALGFFLLRDTYQVNRDNRKMVRNFYGALQVRDLPNEGPDYATRRLVHGTIKHGEQFLSPKRRREPISYYGPESGVGLAIRVGQAQPGERVGVIGLGTGTIAAFARRGDHYTFYDINPLVPDIAQTEFTYVQDARDAGANVDIVLGDARLSLEREPPQNFDVLAVDAFSSDAIPVHLLTKEAFALYFRHLKPGGILAVHISNRYLDLAPVVATAAAALGKTARLVWTDSDEVKYLAASRWILVTGQPAVFESDLLQGAAEPIQSKKKIRLWTDDYSNLFQILQ